jgi:hypothetical protein
MATQRHILEDKCRFLALDPNIFYCGVQLSCGTDSLCFMAENGPRPICSESFYIESVSRLLSCMDPALLVRMHR